MKTWIIESLVVLTILFIPFFFREFQYSELICLFAVWFTFMESQVRFKPMIYNNIIAIDTGCGKGGILSAVDLESFDMTMIL